MAKLQDAGYRIQDTGCRIQDTRCKMQDNAGRNFIKPEAFKKGGDENG